MNKFLVFLQQCVLCFDGGLSEFSVLKVNGFFYFSEGVVTFLMNVDH